MNKDEKLKIAYVGSNPAANSGFGVVTRYLLKHLYRRGFDIACLGYLEDPDNFEQDQYDYPVETARFENTLEEGVVRDFCLRHRADVILLHDEINICKIWFEKLMEQPKARTPVICYVPVYGEPVAHAFIPFLRAVRGVIAYTRFGCQIIEKYAEINAHFAHLGVDRDVFYPYDRARRDAMRDFLGWGDKFVVMFVSRNRLNKQHTKLIKAMAMMRKMKYKDILCYIHCNPVEEYSAYGGGVDLTRWVRHAGLEDTVFFPEEMETQERGIALYDEGTDLPSPGRGRTKNKLRHFGLPSRYNLADFYIHPSLAEGFGLPLVEAMATGLPLAHTDDGGAMSEVTGRAGFRMQPVRKERNAIGTICSSVTTAAVFGTLKKFYHEYREGRSWEALSGKSLKRAHQFSWENTAEKIAEIIKARLARRREEGKQ
jgi:glycosyltransferase involved in cell wall biosynthesis